MVRQSEYLQNKFEKQKQNDGNDTVWERERERDKIFSVKAIAWERVWLKSAKKVPGSVVLLVVVV